MVLVAATWALFGCVRQVGERVQSEVDGSVTRLEADVERGDLEVLATEAATVSVTADLAAEGSRAQRRLDEATVSTELVLDILRLGVRAPSSRVRAEVQVRGPDVLDVAASAPEGGVRIEGVTGHHDVEAAWIEVVGGAGPRHLVATRDGMRVEGDPAPGDAWVLDVTGDLDLFLPAGLELRLDAVLSEGARAEVTGLTFDEILATDDFVRARTGSGAIDIRIDVRGGTLVLAERVDLR